MIRTFVCGCEFSRGYLWTRACGFHRFLLKHHEQWKIQACVVLEKSVDELNQYEDQLILEWFKQALHDDVAAEYPVQDTSATRERTDELITEFLNRRELQKKRVRRRLHGE